MSLRPRILVIDDEPGMLRAIERALEGDHVVTTQTDPSIAIESIRAQPFDLVITDVNMKPIDGFAVLDSTKSARPDLDVILMTGVAEPDAFLLQAIRQKAYYFLAKPFDREVLRALVSRCLESRRLREAQRQHLLRIDREVSDARALQRSILRRTTFLNDHVDLVVHFEPCSELAGDFYDYATTPTHLALIVGDVVGHGVSAAMLTAGAIASFRFAAHESFEPRAVLRGLHAQFLALPAEFFCTCVIARLDLRDGSLELLNAGHPSPIVLRNDQPPRVIDQGSPLINKLFDLDVYDVHRIHLTLGERLLIYTDGLTECEGTHDQFGLARLIECLRLASTSSQACVERLVESIRQHAGNRPPHDDHTLLLIERLAK